MSLCVEKFRVAGSKEWDRIWAECEYSTYFHSREWAEIWQSYHDGERRPAAYLLRFSDGKTALLPLAWYSHLQIYYSTMSTCYGGLIAREQLETGHLDAAITFVREMFGSLFIRVNPFWDGFDPEFSCWRFQADETEVLSLDVGMVKLVKAWTKGHRSAASKARREGVAVRQATSRADWHAYFALYEASLVRWGERASSRYRWELFGRMCERNSPNIKLWLAEHDGRTVAGALCLYAGRHAAYWHGAALENSFPLRPVHLLIHEILQHAVDIGCRWFDLGPSGGHEGVRLFKKGFGSVSLSCPWIEVESIGGEGHDYMSVAWLKSVMSKHFFVTV